MKPSRLLLQIGLSLFTVLTTACTYYAEPYPVQPRVNISYQPRYVPRYAPPPRYIYPPPPRYVYPVPPPRYFGWRHGHGYGRGHHH